MEKVLEKPRTDYRGGLTITRHDIARLMLGVFGFFIGRVIVFDFINPVAPAFLAGFFGTGLQFYILLLFSLAGLMTKLSGVYMAKYVICFSLAASVNIFITQRGRRSGIYICALAIAIISLFSGLFLALMYSASPYLLTVAVFESALTATLTVIIKKGSDIVFGNKKRKVLSNEEIISLAVIFGAVITGSADIYVSIVSLKFFLCAYVILVASFKGGGAFGCTVGLLLGLILYMAGLASSGTCIIFAIGGLCASIFKFGEKLGAIIGFSLGGTVASLYFGVELLNIELLASIISAVILFTATPNNFYFNISAGISPALDNTDEYLLRVKEIASGRLAGISESIYKLAKAFKTLGKKKDLDQGDVTKLIDDIAARACNNCGNKELCWQRNFYDTYQTVFGILSANESSGMLAIDDIPKRFKNNCLNVTRFVAVTNRLFEIYKNNIYWQNQIIESRKLVSEQLDGVARIINSLASEINLEISFNSDMEESILIELTRNRIEVSSVVVLVNKLGKYEVTIEHKPCTGRKSYCGSTTAIVSKLINRRMRRESDQCGRKRDVCRTRLVEEQRYILTSGVARSVKENVSGDSYSHMELKNGQYLLALSDGMGSGSRAHTESQTAIELLENFIEAGFDKDISVKIINSVLVLKSGEESFSTLDICSVDLYSGEAEFIKIGAAQTYVLRGGTVFTVNSSSLPIGILDTVDIEVSTKKLREDDIIIMMTDGVSEAGSEDGWLKIALSDIDSKNPQDVADFLLDTACAVAGEEIKDDMTVMVSRLWVRD